MYEVRPNLVLGFHGCDASIRDSLLANPNEIVISKKPYDWLGNGMYFWKNNLERALQWASDKKKRGEIKEPAVIGATLHLGYCCDFLDSRHIKTLQPYYSLMVGAYDKLGIELPTNRDLPNDKHKDKILRDLDCAVIQFMHNEMLNDITHDITSKGFTNLNPFDSVRGVFTEGAPAFEGAGLFEKSHIQICVRNLNCIKGFFMPRKETDFIKWLQSNQKS